MKTMKTPMAFLVLAAPLSGTAQAALQGRDRDGNLATSEADYDSTHLNMAWLADANCGAGSSYAGGRDTPDGRLTWANALAWATNLRFTDGVNVYDNWRPPTVDLLRPTP